MKIPKELLNAVLNINVCIEDINPYIQDNMVIYDILDYKSINTKHINIYELAHKCKEWSNKQGYKKVYSGIYESTDQGSLYICIISSKEGNYTLDFWADTEIEAIFKACQWILDNKN